jgi:ligand-binding sensor domain-containing protein
MKYLKIIPFVLITLFWSCSDKKTEETPEDETIKEISAVVNCIAVDKNNTKWIGTNDGLYKSITGGYELVELSAPGKIYSLFYNESQNSLWIGTETGLLEAKIGSDNLTETAIPNQNLSNPKVRTMYMDDNSKLWFGSEKGLSLNYGETWKKEKFRVNIQNKLFVTEIENYTINSISSWDGDYFFATSGAKLYRAFDYNTSVDAFSGATQWDPPYNGTSITDTMFVVFIDKAGKQWMGGMEGIQVHTGHDPKVMSSFTYYSDELPDNYVLAINQAPNGDIWVGTRKGIAKFNGSGWTLITNGLPDLFVSSIAFDKDGKAWIGTKKGLVSL